MGYLIRFAAAVMGILSSLGIIVAGTAYLLTRDSMWGWFTLLFLLGGLAMLGVFHNLKDYEL